MNGTKMMCDMVSSELMWRPIIVRGTEIRGSFETSPAGWRALRAFFEQRDLTRNLNASCIFEECARSLELCDSSGCMRLGWYDWKDEEWRWDVLCP